MKQFTRGARPAIAAIAVTASVGLPLGAALAGEGNGEPFPGPDAMVTTKVGTPVYAHKNQDPFQFSAPATSMSMTEYKPLSSKAQDPYPFHGPDTVVAPHAPVIGPESGVAAAQNNTGGAGPQAPHG